jgi:hypothetical protein
MDDMKELIEEQADIVLAVRTALVNKDYAGALKHAEKLADGYQALRKKAGLPPKEHVLKA